MKGSGRADPGRQREILERVLDDAARAGHRGVAVFDLDSTLLDNRPRQARILSEYGASVSHAILSGSRPEHWQGWDMRVAMRNAGLPAGEIERHHDPARRFWRDRFFTGPYCAIDIPVPGAPEYVNRIHATGCQVAYVTGRHIEMGEGTLAAFRRGGFPSPDGDRIHLLLKPTFELHDDAWKVDARTRLDQLGEVIAAFDNEPAHVNGYAEAYPGAMVVHLDTDHSQRPVEILDRIPSISDFRM